MLHNYTPSALANNGMTPQLGGGVAALVAQPSSVRDSIGS